MPAENYQIKITKLLDHQLGMFPWAVAPVGLPTMNFRTNNSRCQTQNLHHGCQIHGEAPDNAQWVTVCPILKSYPRWPGWEGGHWWGRTERIFSLRCRKRVTPVSSVNNQVMVRISVFGGRHVKELSLPWQGEWARCGMTVEFGTLSHHCAQNRKPPTYMNDSDTLANTWGSHCLIVVSHLLWMYASSYYCEELFSFLHLSDKKVIFMFFFIYSIDSNNLSIHKIKNENFKLLR